MKHAFVATGSLKNIRLTVSTKIYFKSNVQKNVETPLVATLRYLHLPVTCVSLLFDKSKLYKTGVPFKVILTPIQPSFHSGILRERG